MSGALLFRRRVGVTDGKPLRLRLCGNTRTKWRRETVLAYNLQRAIKILGAKTLIAEMRA
jgi:hypothetical protein